MNLSGGYINEVVRVGDTVRRSIDTGRGGVHELLRFLEEVDYPAPRFRGVDEQGGETLTFVVGHVPHGNQDIDAVTERRSLAAVARLVRGLHDLTVGSWLAGDAEAVCHNDLSPTITVYDTDGGWWRPVAFIDWDLAGPDRRRATSDAAGADRHVIDRSELVPTIVWWQQRCADGIERGADAGDPAMKALRQHGALEEVRAAHAWVSLNRRRLDATVLRDQS